jgi:mitogen-activated protein kinase kinase
VEQEKRRQLTKELQTLAYSNSPYLINFRGAYFDDGHIHMALEFMSGGSLQDLIGTLLHSYATSL